MKSKCSFTVTMYAMAEITNTVLLILPVLNNKEWRVELIPLSAFHLSVDIGERKFYNRLVNFFMKAGFLNEKR